MKTIEKASNILFELKALRHSQSPRLDCWSAEAIEQAIELKEQLIACAQKSYKAQCFIEDHESEWRYVNYFEEEKRLWE